MRVDFEEVAVTVRSTGACPVCGKRTTRTRKFWQTLNPFNRLPDGAPKTADDIRRELNQQADEWEPDHRHTKCVEQEVP